MPADGGHLRSGAVVVGAAAGTGGERAERAGTSPLTVASGRKRAVLARHIGSSSGETWRWRSYRGHPELAEQVAPRRWGVVRLRLAGPKRRQTR